VKGSEALAWDWAKPWITPATQITKTIRLSEGENR
jgi:hypothetical protein